MYKEKQTIHYCTILSAGQWDFLLEGKSSAFRQKCLYRLMTGAVRERTAYKIKGVEIVLEVGQVAASDVELAEFLGCNRKTIGKLIDSFNRLGMLTTRTNNRTSIHSLHFLTGWYVDSVLITNPHYVKPTATAKGQTGNVRTPVFDSLPSESRQNAAADDSQAKEQEADSMAAGAAVLSSSLCSSETSNPSSDRPDDDCHYPPSDMFVADEAGNLPLIDSGDGVPERNDTESPKETQDGTIGGEADSE
ncbi:hypothetical protein GA398_13980 [Bacteroides xylanisolvens]|uniref:Helix-turn-helix domain-containing protein n=1 Tax=Bacteroides xylanisolvens TaxID=371601 RepID=A0A7J5PW24_9BACE|nr:hypothetical protein [Bacteroides xylanisolvens]KAB6146845.1 hypothetical protein GA398_13980 [Bacteroides xylanisolvens]